MPTYYLRSGTQTWNTNAAWSLSSGGGATGLIPTALDDIILDANSGSVTLATTTGVCKSIDATDYTGTVTFTVGLTVSGNITLGASMGISGAGTLTVNAASTIDSKGKIWPNTFTMSGTSLTITLANNDFQVGAFTNSNTTGVLNGVGRILKVNGSMTMSQALTGTATIQMIGTGSWTGTGALGNNLTFNSTGTVTIATVTYTPQSGGSTITYTAGTVNAGTGTITINGPNALTLNTAGMSWFNMSFTTNSLTITLNSALTINGTLSFLAGIIATFAGSYGFTAATLSRTDSPATGTGLTLTPGNTYTVTSSFIHYPASNSITIGIKSATPGSQATLVLSQGATSTLGRIAATDIDSSAGQTIWVWNPGTLSNTTNWKTLSPSSMQFSSAFVS